MKPHYASSEKARRNHMNDEPQTTIEREVKSWPGGHHRRHWQGWLAVQLRSGGAGAPARLQLRRPPLSKEGARRAHSTRASIGASAAARVGLGAPEDG